MSPMADRKLMAEINVIPLVDISLVLLIIFMVTTAFVKEAGLNMQLPATSAQAAMPEQKNDVAIALDAGSQLYLDGRKIELAELANLLKLRAKQNNQARVIVKADGRVNYAKVMQVLDAAKLAGLEKIALATVIKETK